MNRYIRIILDSLPKTFKISRVASKMDNDVKKVRVETTTRMKRTRSTADPDAITDHEEKKVKQEERIKKKKVAIMFAYSGVGYFGLQRNQGMKTIEGDLMEALYKAGLITEENFHTPQSLQFQRAARTDKGVSALKQIVSLKLPEAAMKEDINTHLPEQIRVLSIKRVTKGFNSKNSCDARTYSYTCPSYAFASPGETKEDFRLTKDRLKFIEALLKQYEGTHNFHNFTSKRKPLDPSCSRYIMSFQCEQPFVREGLELITLKVKGQSFMLHQIRKMVGVAMAIARGYVSQDIVEKTYGLDQYDLPMAPGLGLLLEQVHYDIYNMRFGEDGVHESLHFHEVDDEVNRFRERFILPYIAKVETTEKPMLAWLELLGDHSFDTRQVKAALAAANGEVIGNTEDADEETDEKLRIHSNGSALGIVSSNVKKTEVEVSPLETATTLVTIPRVPVGKETSVPAVSLDSKSNNPVETIGKRDDVATSDVNSESKDDAESITTEKVELQHESKV